jgi:hypothetical protein
MENSILENFKSTGASIAGIGSAVTQADIDIYGYLMHVKDASFKIRTIVSAWETQQREERSMRKCFGFLLLIALSFQALLINTAFFLIGFSIIVVEKWVAVTFIMSVFGEMVGLLYFVMNYLFPKGNISAAKLLKEL